MVKIKIKTLIFIISLIISIFFTGCIDNTNNYDQENKIEEKISIQKMINNASYGDTINIPNGIYYENIIINKSITLIGENKEKTIIDGINLSNELKNVITIKSDNIKITGFTIKNGINGIEINGNNITIKDNIIQNNSKNDYDTSPYYNSGIIILSSKQNIIKKNILINNSYSGIVLYDNSNKNNIYRNTIIKNNYGINIINSSNNTIIKNNFIENNISAQDNDNNTWYEKEKGNFWSDYIYKYSNASKINGYWNISYLISGGNNSDKYPHVDIINNKSNVSFTIEPINPTTNDIIKFNDESYDEDGYIKSWLWDFGDGTNSTEKKPQHKYKDNGYYTITLKVKDNLNATNQTTKKINVLNMKPNIDFNYLPISPNDLDNITFIDKSYDTDGNIVFYEWDFGDGNISNNKNATHRFLDNGIYEVTLTIKDDDEEYNTTKKQINVLNVPPTPIFSYNPKKPTINDTINFIDSSRDDDGIIISWNWDFDDGTTSDEKSPSHKFNEGKNYKVYLTVTDDDGDSNTIRKDIIVDDTVNKDEERGFIIIYVLFIIVFIIMIGVVIKVAKKYNK